MAEESDGSVIMTTGYQSDEADLLAHEIRGDIEKPGKNGEVQITDALLEQAKNGCVLAYQFKGKRFDCGSIEGFVEATNYVYENIYKKEKAKKK